MGHLRLGCSSEGGSNDGSYRSASPEERRRFVFLDCKSTLNYDNLTQATENRFFFSTNDLEQLNDPLGSSQYFNCLRLQKFFTAQFNKFTGGQLDLHS